MVLATRSNPSLLVAAQHPAHSPMIHESSTTFVPANLPPRLWMQKKFVYIPRLFARKFIEADPASFSATYFTFRHVGEVKHRAPLLNSLQIPLSTVASEYLSLPIIAGAVML